ncbi:putative signal transducing protein [Polaribacter atrinae]|uniref:putative signal transducing protein n=1 Tax=Polaribacter atrinae TaxID=1333662 RepID=UPI0030FB2380
MSEDYTKVFTDNSILVNGLQSLLKEAGIDSIVSDGVESGRLAGFGVPSNSVELFILKTDLKEAEPIIDSFKIKINS